MNSVYELNWLFYVILVNRGRYELSPTKYIVTAQNFKNKSYKHYLQIISI